MRNFSSPYPNAGIWRMSVPITLRMIMEKMIKSRPAMTAVRIFLAFRTASGSPRDVISLYPAMIIRMTAIPAAIPTRNLRKSLINFPGVVPIVPIAVSTSRHKPEVGSTLSGPFAQCGGLVGAWVGMGVAVGMGDGLVTIPVGRGVMFGTGYSFLQVPPGPSTIKVIGVLIVFVGTCSQVSLSQPVDGSQ